MTNKLKKYFYLSIGFISIILGTIGIFLPVLPTVPFLLLALFCFSKSSEKAYQYIINNKYFGKTIRDYKEGKGVTLAVKIRAIIYVTAGIAFSIYKSQSLHLRIFLVVVWLGVSIHLITLKIKK
ncbi:YbaN family protein [Fusobacterium russii]|uniref:YbaN family protein n=1 Tax=Fusobacterium russii TaxID=854 RepID=UPI00039B6900|nr:YbaN family protein [Fusobacterium russii]